MSHYSRTGYKQIHPKIKYDEFISETHNYPSPFSCYQKPILLNKIILLEEPITTNENLKTNQHLKYYVVYSNQQKLMYNFKENIRKQK